MKVGNYDNFSSADVTIKFEFATYNVCESDRTVNVTIVLTGRADRDLSVLLSTRNGTAICKQKIKIGTTSLFALKIALKQGQPSLLHACVHLFCIFHVRIFSAFGERDFIPIDSMLITFPASSLGHQSRVIPITIINDNFVENDENFAALVSLSTTDSAILLQPAEAAITIIDDDGKEILSFIIQHKV